MNDTNDETQVAVTPPGLDSPGVRRWLEVWAGERGYRGLRWHDGTDQHGNDVSRLFGRQCGPVRRVRAMGDELNLDAYREPNWTSSVPVTIDDLDRHLAYLTLAKRERHLVAIFLRTCEGWIKPDGVLHLDAFKRDGDCCTGAGLGLDLLAARGSRGWGMVAIRRQASGSDEVDPVHASHDDVFRAFDSLRDFDPEVAAFASMRERNAWDATETLTRLVIRLSQTKRRLFRGWLNDAERRGAAPVYAKPAAKPQPITADDVAPVATADDEDFAEFDTWEANAACRFVEKHIGVWGPAGESLEALLREAMLRGDREQHSAAAEDPREALRQIMTDAAAAPAERIRAAEALIRYE